MGVVGSAAVLIGKFEFGSNPATYTGIVVLVVASAWNAWPRADVESCSCEGERYQ
jgi:hypothetical protein